MSLMKAETEAFLRQDFEALRQHWIAKETSRFLISWPGVGSRVYSGIEEISAMLSASVAETPPEADIEGSVERRNVSLVVGDDIAWVSYDQVSRLDDPDFILNGVQHELKIFHRVNSEWKIACVVVMAQQVEHLADPMVQVKRDLSVEWANPGGSAMIKDHPGLEISRNRLRARNRRFQDGLREAVGWAHDRLFASPQKNRGGSNRIKAVALGEDDKGGPVFCWVFVEDGKVLVAFDAPGAQAAQLERARSLFGLSPGQMRLLPLLIQGEELATAAVHLGISVNTARTQLNRVFEKMGVHGQAAMIRRLVSLRVPTKN